MRRQLGEWFRHLVDGESGASVREVVEGFAGATPDAPAVIGAPSMAAGEVGDDPGGRA